MRKKLFLLLGISLCLIGCSRESEEGTEKQIYNPGTYTYTTEGEYGEMSVEVVLSETAIEEINIVSSHDTNSILDDVRNEYIANVILLQNPDIDLVAGATGSCQGVYDAVKQAIEENTYEQTE